jgi:hypothetical protein
MGILSKKMRSWSLASSLFIIIFFFLYTFVIVKVIMGERENKIVESTLRMTV